MKRPDLTRLRELSPWLARDVLWCVQALTLASVSAWYSTVWTARHGFPGVLAGSTFVALEVGALLGLAVIWRPRTPAARRHAVALVIGSAAAAAAVNALAHAAQRGAVPVTTLGVVATGAVAPLWLAWCCHVARGMAPRPSARKVPARTPSAQPATRKTAPEPKAAEPSAPHPVADDATGKIRAALRAAGYPDTPLPRGAFARLDEQHGTAGSGLARQVAKALREEAAA